MKSLCCLVLLVVVALVHGRPGYVTYNLSKAPELYEQFVIEHGRTFKNPLDKEIHYREFVKTLKMINKHNSDPYVTYSMGLNFFADMTEEEKRPYTHGLLPNYANVRP